MLSPEIWGRHDCPQRVAVPAFRGSAARSRRRAIGDTGQRRRSLAGGRIDPDGYSAGLVPVDEVGGNPARPGRLLSGDDTD